MNNIPEAEYTCVLYGKQYHSNKGQFKKILKAHGMEYSGSFIFPYWGGENEYIRGEFQREYDERSGKDETKLATLSLYLRKDGTPTSFSEEFMDWCEQAKLTEVNGEIPVFESPIVEEPTEDCSKEWKRLVASKFKTTGRSQLSKQDIVFGIAFDKGWASPKEAADIVDRAIERGYLKNREGNLVPTFDVQEVEYPQSYSPDWKCIEEDGQ